MGVAMLAWLAGVGAYLVTLALTEKNVSMVHELPPVLFWGGLFFLLGALPFYFVILTPLHLVLRRGRRGPIVPPAWFYVVLGAALGALPAYVLFRGLGGWVAWRAVLLFYAFFGTTGVVFSAGWWWIYGRKAGGQ